MAAASARAVATVLALCVSSLVSAQVVPVADPDAARLERMGFEQRSHSAVDEIGAAFYRWEFPRLEAAQLEVGQTLVFVLPGARSIEIPLVERNLVAEDALGLSFSDPSSGASAAVVITRGVVRGSVTVPNGRTVERWSLSTGVDTAGIAGDYYESLDGIDAESMVDPVDPTDANGTKADDLPPGGDGADGGVAEEGCDDSGAIIDVMFVFTPGFRQLYASSDAMQAAMLGDLQTTNLALANSLSTPRFRAVGFVAITDASSGSIATDLARLRSTNDGWADGIHQSRNLLRADLVVLYTDSPGQSAAYLGVGNQADGFSAVRATGGYALARALGTNMGCCNATGDAPACTGVFTFSKAFRFTVGSTTYRTIMGEAPGQEIPNFSNPVVTYLGAATGSATANNARTMSLTSAQVSKYRCSTGASPDCDGDGIVDSVAIANGIVPDCNRTGLPDSCDIALGISLDANNNGIPDECPLVDSQLIPAGVGPLDTVGTSVSASQRAADPVVLFGFGGPGSDVNAANSGAAWVLPVTGGVPNIALAQVLRASDPQVNAFFGRGISVFKRPANTTTPVYPALNMAAVTAHRFTVSLPTGLYPSMGKLYLFEEGGTGTWAQTKTYTPPATGGNAAGANALFGSSLAFGRSPTEASETVVVGAPGRNNGEGAVYVVRNTATIQIHVLRTLTSPVAGDQFGQSVALATRIPTLSSGGTPGASRVVFVAGAPGRASNTGTVQVFERPVSSSSFGTWAAPVALAPQGTPLAAGDRYGASVAILARATTPTTTAPTALVAIGAPGDDEGRGRVYFFERGTATGSTIAWSFRGSFQPADAQPGDAFGSSVSIAAAAAGPNFVITVGAPKADVPVGALTRVDAGKFYVLTRVPGAASTTLAATRTAFAPASGDEFGFSAASVAGFGIIGAPFNDSAGLNVGTVRITVNP